jgi:hypothetical protein
VVSLRLRHLIPLISADVVPPPTLTVGDRRDPLSDRPFSANLFEPSTTALPICTDILSDGERRSDDIEKDGKMAISNDANPLPSVVEGVAALFDFPWPMSHLTLRSSWPPAEMAAFLQARVFIFLNQTRIFRMTLAASPNICSSRPWKDEISLFDSCYFHQHFLPRSSGADTSPSGVATTSWASAESTLPCSLSFLDTLTIENGADCGDLVHVVRSTSPLRCVIGNPHPLEVRPRHWLDQLQSLFYLPPTLEILRFDGSDMNPIERVWWRSPTARRTRTWPNVREIHLGNFSIACEEDQRYIYGDNELAWVSGASRPSYFSWLTRVPLLERISFSTDECGFLADVPVLEHFPPLPELQEIRIELTMSESMIYADRMNLSDELLAEGHPQAISHSLELSDGEKRLAHFTLFHIHTTLRLECPKLRRVVLCIDCPHVRRVYAGTPAIHALLKSWFPSYTSLSPADQSRFITIEPLFSVL